MYMIFNVTGLSGPGTVHTARLVSSANDILSTHTVRANPSGTVGIFYVEKTGWPKDLFTVRVS